MLIFTTPYPPPERTQNLTPSTPHPLTPQIQHYNQDLDSLVPSP